VRERDAAPARAVVRDAAVLGTPLQRAPSSGMPQSSASFSRDQRTTTTPFACRKAVSSMSSATDQPSAS
jgi:hypothetical protein